MQLRAGKYLFYAVMIYHEVNEDPKYDSILIK